MALRKVDRYAYSRFCPNVRWFYWRSPAKFQSLANGQFGLSSVDRLSSHFGTSFEATVYRLATAHPGIAVAGMLQYRLTKDEARKAKALSDQGVLFAGTTSVSAEPTQRKYRRQSVHLSTACSENEYTIRYNKSFDASSIVYKARQGGIHVAVEDLPNLANAVGRIEAMLCPYQSENADSEFGDVFFFWEEIATRV